MYCVPSWEYFFLTVVLLKHLCIKQVGYDIIFHFHQEQDVGQGDTAPGLTFDLYDLALPGRE